MREWIVYGPEAIYYVHFNKSKNIHFIIYYWTSHTEMAIGDYTKWGKSRFTAVSMWNTVCFCVITQ